LRRGHSKRKRWTILANVTARVVAKIVHCAARDWDYVSAMDWQQFVSLVIVAVAASALAWSRIRRRKFSFERNTHCSCSPIHDSSTQSSIVFHARKGGRPQILMKMK